MSLKTYFCYLKLQHLSSQARKSREHVSTQDTLACKHVSTQETLAREHVNTEGTLAREHVTHGIQQTPQQLIRITISMMNCKTKFKMKRCIKLSLFLVSLDKLLFHNILELNLITFQYSFDSPQVKPNLVSTIKIFVYELPLEFPNNLSFKILENQEILGKSQLWLETQGSSIKYVRKIFRKN